MACGVIIVSDNALTILNKKLRETMNERADFLAGGSCPDFETYKHVAGVIEGLALAEYELLKLNKQIEEDF